MSKTIQEQIANKCIHFNGIMNDTCEAGVKYSDVRVGKPYKFPCLNKGGECDKCRFRTPEEVEQELKEIELITTQGITVWAKVMESINNGNKVSGAVPCDCGGTITYQCAESNGHIRLKCNKCQFSIIE